MDSAYFRVSLVGRLCSSLAILSRTCSHLCYCIAARSPYDAELFHVPQLDDEDLPGFGFFNSRLVEHTILRDNGYAAARR